MMLTQKLRLFQIKYIIICFFSLILSKQTLAKDQFWWGISTSSYQTEEESQNFKTDWDVFFQNGHLKEKKGLGTSSYSNIKRDIEALKSLGVSHYRFGIEWARIETAPGTYDQEALNHYYLLILALKKANITPIVCFWHFTFPDWLYDEINPDKSGWLHPEFSKHWKNYIEIVTKKFGSEVSLYAPQNEPNAYALAAFFLGRFPPGVKNNLALYRKQIKGSADAFIDASQIIKKISPDSKIITIQNMIYWKPVWWDLTSYFYNIGQEYNFEHLDQVNSFADFIGFNYYYERRATPFNSSKISNPQGLKFFVNEFTSRFKKPIVIMENGIADDGDEIRYEYLKSHLQVVKEIRENSFNLIGYFYWSLIDNFEWAEGYQEKYGLNKLSSDRKKLIPKNSSNLYKSIIQADY